MQSELQSEQLLQKIPTRFKNSTVPCLLVIKKSFIFIASLITSSNFLVSVHFFVKLCDRYWSRNQFLHLHSSFRVDQKSRMNRHPKQQPPHCLFLSVNLLRTLRFILDSDSHSGMTHAQAKDLRTVASLLLQSLFLAFRSPTHPF